MGVALYMALEQEIPGFDAASVCGKLLAGANAKLDGIARRHGLTPLEDFISMAPEEMLDFLEGEGMSPEQNVPPEQWFDPSEGLKTIRSLLDALRQNPNGIHRVEGVISDLEAMEQMLRAAADRGVRFHLAVDF